MTKVMRGVLVWCALTGLSACSEAQPDMVYRQFVEALQKHKPKQAWALLSSQTQQALRERSQAVVTAAPGAFRDAPEQMTFQGSRPTELVDVKILERDASTVVLNVSSLTDTRRIKMVKDAHQWRVDLSASLATSALQ
jgi:hypothetical protein